MSDSDTQILDWTLTTQGDILRLEALKYWAIGSEAPERVETPYGVALVSQTCDLVHVSPNDRVLVAPVKECVENEWSSVRKGRRPLLVVVSQTERLVLDLERIVSLPRSVLETSEVIRRTCDLGGLTESMRLGARIGRAFSRFAFPDEVHTALAPLQQKVSERYGKDTYFAEVLRMVDEFRVSCVDWSSPTRGLSVYAIIPSSSLPPGDSKPVGWKWSAQTVIGIRQCERPEQLALERISELLCRNLAEQNDSAVVELWRLWTDGVFASYLDACGDNRSPVEFYAVSGDEFTYTDYVNSELLDFSALSALAPGRGI